MNGYTKLFKSILASSIWSEDDQTRIVWITLLAMADKHGEVHASVPGLARLAGVPIAATETALQRFLSPDPYSRTPDNEGRRLLPMEGGWRIANHAKYRLMASREDEKAKTAARVAAHRAKRAEPVGIGGDAVKTGDTVTDRYKALQGVTDPLQQGVGNGVVTQTMHIADTDTDTETKDALGDTNPLDVGGAGGETVAQPPQDKPAAKAKARKPAPPFVEPKREELDLHAAKIGLPPREVDKFVAYHSARGWMLGSRKMKSWPQAMVTWKLNWEERNGQHGHTGSGSHRPLTPAEQRNATLGDGDLERIQANSDRRARELAEWMAANPDRTPFDGDR
ncbi:MAG: hypothetical protein EBR82_68405 [Caulobacteraceae bacterium]|nr:hypothetical protein [Caulobacteraceae bacterium]